jgi:hypothetical protein
MIMVPPGVFSNPQRKEYQNGDHKWMCAGKIEKYLINLFLNSRFGKYSDFSEVHCASSSGSKYE